MMSYCEQDWMAILGALTFVLGVASTIGCTALQENPCDAELDSMNQKIDKLQKMYHTDLMTILRETLNPPAVACECEPVQWDNNSIPGGE
jgi:hypothetical protein